MQICCKELSYYLNDARSHIYFDQVKRYFAIEVDGFGGIYFMYCPWCGHKFPPHLGNEFYDILKKEYGISGFDADEGNVPEEFKSDKWWKNRGL